MKVRFKKLHPDAVLPSYAKPGDGGMDLVATSIAWDEFTRTFSYGTGLAVEIPEGYIGVLTPRSSIYKTGLGLCNSIGIVDQYRGELIVKFYIHDDQNWAYATGDRICQLIILPFPTIESEWADELSETVRGDSGFGSSGR